MLTVKNIGGMDLIHIALFNYVFSGTDISYSICIKKSSKTSTRLLSTKSMQTLSAAFGHHAALERGRGAVGVFNTPKRIRTRLLQLQQC